MLRIFPLALFVFAMLAPAAVAGLALCPGGTPESLSVTPLGQVGFPAATNPQAPTGPAAGALPSARSGILDYVVFLSAFFMLVIFWLADIIRPGSFSRHPGREVGGVPAAVWLFSGFVLFMVWGSAMILLANQRWLTGVPPEGVSGSVAASALVASGAYLISLFAGGTLIYLMLPRAGNAGLSVKGSDVFVGLGCFLLAVPILYAAMALTPMIYHELTGRVPEQTAHSTLRLILSNKDSWWTVLLVAAVVLGAPIVEELIYRVFLQSAVLGVVRSAWIAILITSAVFAGMHAAVVPVHVLPLLFLVGVTLGVAYERTKRLGVPIVMHAAFNAANVGVALYVA